MSISRDITWPQIEPVPQAGPLASSRVSDGATTAPKLHAARRVLLVGINHAPEKVGIGPYSTEMASSLAAAGYDVEVISAKPYYPTWSVFPAFRKPGYARSIEGGLRITRCPIYTPASPTGMRRVLHHLSFAASIIPPLAAALVRRRPELIVVIAPSMISAPVVRFFGRLTRAKLWLHIQDFEVGAAFATGLLSPGGWRERAAKWFESFAYRGFDFWSSISPQMREKLAKLGFPARKVFELRNWTSIEDIQPMLSGQSIYRRIWDVQTPHVALYSGNISNKQGLETIVEAARLLRHRSDLLFVICGDGPQKRQLIELSVGLTNIRFYELQPKERLNDLMGLATVHMLPQIAGAADLVLPSKLANMLASGRPVIATADPGTGLFSEVEGCGKLVPPGDSVAFAAAITSLLDDEPSRDEASAFGRARAMERWSKTSILSGLVSRISTEILVS